LAAIGARIAVEVVVDIVRRGLTSTGVGVGMGDVDAEDDVIDRSMGDTRRTLFA